MTILLTGFEPFAGEEINPAVEVQQLLDDRIAGAEIMKTTIPTVFNKSIQELREAIEENNPDIVICLGQAGGRYGISIERVAINIADARIEDNEGKQPVDEKIYEDGKNAYFTGLPLKSIVGEIRKDGLPASVSNSAGTYVCNYLMYGLLYLIDKQYSYMLGGFIHVPYLPQQVINKKNKPSMSLQDIARGIEIAVQVTVNEY